MGEVTVGQEQSEEGWVWRASYAAAEKAKIFNGDTLKDSYFGNINPSYLP